MFGRKTRLGRGARTTGTGRLSGGGLRRARVAAFIVVAVLAMATLLPAVASAAVPVSVRVEGEHGTVFASPVLVGTSRIIDTDGVSHTLTNKALCTVDVAARLGAFQYTVKDSSLGLYVESINGEYPVLSPPYPGWMYRVNGVRSDLGADVYALKTRDSVLWYYGTYDASPTALRFINRPVSINRGSGVASMVALQIDPAGKTSPLSGATIHFGSAVVTSGASGEATVSVRRGAAYGVRVEKAGHIRSPLYSVRAGHATAISCIPSARLVRRGSAVWFGARLFRPERSGRTALANRVVLLQRKIGAGAWTTIKSARTGAAGAARMRVYARVSAYYRTVWRGDSINLGDASPVCRVGVR